MSGIFNLLSFQDQLDYLFEHGEHLVRIDEFSDLYIMEERLVIAYRRPDREIYRFYIFYSIIGES